MPSPQQLSTIMLEGSPVPRISLLPPNPTPQAAPKTIGGEPREQVQLCDPLTGDPMDIQGSLKAGYIEAYVGTIADGTVLILRFPSARTVTKITARCTSGSATLTPSHGVDASFTNFGSAMGISSTEASNTYSEHFDAGDEIKLVASSSSSCVEGRIQIDFRKDAA